MKKWMMRYLPISILAALVSCSKYVLPGQPANVDAACLEKFKPPFKSELFSTSVDVMGRHVSGLLLVKSMPDSSIRLVFTNEAGVKFFDFGYRFGICTVHQVIPQLNRKRILRTLQQDFGLALLLRVGKEAPSSFVEGKEIRFRYPGKKDRDQVVTDLACENLVRMENGTDKEVKTQVSWYGQSGQVPDSILIRHFNFDMLTKLRRVNRL